MADLAQKHAMARIVGAHALPADAAKDTVKRAIEAVRSHLGMDVAYVSEFVAGRSVFREVDAPGLEALVKVGDSHSLDDVYCQHILEGRLPELMPDTSAEPLARALPITRAVPIGAHVSVPIRLPDGRAYGMFCCLSFEPDRSLNKRDLQMMRAFADITAFEIDRDLEAARDREEKLARVRRAVDADGIAILYQPIFSLESGRAVGLECLARFSVEPARTPDVWFNEAAEVGLGTELEVAAIRPALHALQALRADAYLAVNVSPPTILSSELAEALEGLPAERIVLEVTEHASVADYSDLFTALRPMRERGIRLAVDDAGAGYSSLRHILDLQPDIIKLDMGLTRNIDLDPARRALAAALIGFSRDTGSLIVAEGVETASELRTLSALGVDMGQGFFLGRPMPLADAAALFKRDEDRALSAA